MIGCQCPVCHSAHPRNDRTRASIWVRGEGGEGFLVDTSPDLRQQALREGIARVDAVFLTHTHADHVNGIDDMRSFNGLQEQVIPCYGKAEVLTETERRFHYCFGPPPSQGKGWYRPVLEAHPLAGPLEWDGTRIQPIPVLHGRDEIFGYRFNDFAYLTDVKEIPEASLELLQGVEVVILDCLRFDPHPAHMSLSEAWTAARRIGARQTFFTHFTHNVDYWQLTRELPEDIQPAYDGLRLYLPLPSRHSPTNPTTLVSSSKEL